MAAVLVSPLRSFFSPLSTLFRSDWSCPSNLIRQEQTLDPLKFFPCLFRFHRWITVGSHLEKGRLRSLVLSHSRSRKWVLTPCPKSRVRLEVLTVLITLNLLTFTLFCIFWTYCTSLVDNFDKENPCSLNELISRVKPSTQSAQLADDETFEDWQLLFHSLNHEKNLMPKMDNISVYWNTAGGIGVPHSFAHYLTKTPALPRVVVSIRKRSRRYFLHPTSLISSSPTCTSSTHRFSSFWEFWPFQGFHSRINFSSIGFALSKECFLLLFVLVLWTI